MTKWQAVTTQGGLLVVLEVLLSAPWVTLFHTVLIYVIAVPLGVTWVANLWKVNKEDQS